MASLRSLLSLGGAALLVGAGARVVAAEPAASASSVHAELLQLLKTDAKAGVAAPPARAASPPAAKAVAAAPAAAVRPAPTAAIGEPLSPQLWSYFTDTGILASDHGKKVTQELTFGPCTDGELLNQRFFW
jgi:hypothetical protein